MADEVLKHDLNSKGVSAGVSNDASTDIIQFRIDSTTKGLKSDAVLPSAIVDGRKTVTTPGTAVALVAVATGCRRLVVTALITNTDYVVVGASTVVAAEATRRGTPLVAGQSLELEISDVSLIFIDAVVAGEGVSFIYLS
uniref:Uncharacterized protein n=1 Tax=viral metagenome TaxID=1070528 RepID=A0A6M3IM53_9ZZZZ